MASSNAGKRAEGMQARLEEQVRLLSPAPNKPGCVEPLATPPAGMFSIRKEFDNAHVLLTGATGFVGGLVLEQLLRLTSVGRIYVLVRSKRGASAQDRVARVLHSGLFHMVRGNKELLSKVHVLDGDLSMERMGVSPAELKPAMASLTYVIHCAASIELEAEVGSTLKQNYGGTERLLQMAQEMPSLRAFTHVSSAYVNVNKPRGSSVTERIYPLKLGGQPISHRTVVNDLLGLPKDNANIRAQLYLDNWGFPNTYTMGKHLAEHMVAEYQAKGMPVAIVRPSLVSGLATTPYPGFTGNLAGPLGMALAQAIGLFDGINSVALAPTHVWDVIPGDRVASVILATAAAMSAGLSIGGCGAIDMQSTKAPASAAAPAGPEAAAAQAPTAAPVMTTPPRDAESAAAGKAVDNKLLVVHACTSTYFPVCYLETQHMVSEFLEAHPAPFKLPGSSSTFKMPLHYQPNDRTVERLKYYTAIKVSIVLWLLRRLGQHKTARRLHYGHVAWQIQNTSKTDKGIFYETEHLLELHSKQDPADTEDFPLLWTAEHGGWSRYSRTQMAGMYRMVFGMDVDGDHDFKFVKNEEPPEAVVKGLERGALGPLRGFAGAAEPEDEREVEGPPAEFRRGFSGEAPQLAQPAADAPAPVREHEEERDIIEHGAKVFMSHMVMVPADSAKEGELPERVQGVVDEGGVKRRLTMTLGRSISGFGAERRGSLQREASGSRPTPVLSAHA